MLTKSEIMAKKPLVIAGPCAVESREQIVSIAIKLKELGADMLRTQLWKPRTTPNAFQGVGVAGLEWIAEAKEKTGLPVAIEIVDRENIEQTKGVGDVLWVGARNMQNFELLKAIGADERVVILKRGFIANIKEVLGAMEYCGKEKTIVCERGIRSGSDSMRFTLDLNTALVLKHDHNLDVLVDPSHTAGRRDMVPHLALGAIAAGLDGVIVEVHENPEAALSDADQQITPEAFGKLVEKINSIYKIVE